MIETDHQQSTGDGFGAYPNPGRFDLVKGDSILEVIGHVAARIIPPTSHPSGERMFSRHMILVVICWAYLNEIYLMSEIEDLLNHDPRFRHWKAWEPPDDSGLRNFRSTHRLAIDCCLYEMFLTRKGLRSTPCSSAEFCEGFANSKFQKEFEIWDQVQERIETAIAVDHLSLED